MCWPWQGEECQRRTAPCAVPVQRWRFFYFLFKASKDLVQPEHCFSSPGIQLPLPVCPVLFLSQLGPLLGPGSPRDASTRGTCRVPAQLHISLPLQPLCCSEVDLGLFFQKKSPFCVLSAGARLDSSGLVVSAACPALQPPRCFVTKWRGRILPLSFGTQTQPLSW